MHESDGDAASAMRVFVLANELLSRHVQVHDRVFAFRIRNLFSPIPFDQCHAAAARNAQDLAETVEVLARDNSFLTKVVGPSGFSVIHDYLRRLHEATARLSEITRKLALKARSERKYPSDEYKLDMKEYQTAVDAYGSMGSRMNEIMKTMKQRKDPA